MLAIDQIERKTAGRGVTEPAVFRTYLTKINAHRETVSLHSLEPERLQYKPPDVFGAG